MNNNDRLAITTAEKKLLKSNGISVQDIPNCSIKVLKEILNSSEIRAMEIKAQTEFESLPSIGKKFAHDLITLGYYSLAELKNKNPVKLYNQFEKMVGAWADPCLEDQFRLVVHYANNPGSTKNWWDFTPERKQYRELYGYAADRPKKPWYQLEEYQKTEKLPSKSAITKKEIVKRLNFSMSYIKKNYAEKITLTQLAKMAMLSPFHFQRSFKAVYDKSPLEYVTHFRLKKACLLLKKTKKPISDIVIQCGFENTSSFIRLFKKSFRQTPSNYRKESSLAD